MIGYLPKRPEGNSAEARFMQWVWDSLRAMRQQFVQGEAVNQTTRGVAVIAKNRTAKGGGTTTTAKSQRCRLKIMRSDYLECVKWDGTTEGDTILVAKPLEARHIASESIEGVTIDYTYASRSNNPDGQRTASATGYPNQVEIVSPIYQIDGDIWADEVEGGTGVVVTGVELTWLERSARCWAKLS